MARPEGIEPPTLCLEVLGFENQMSYCPLPTGENHSETRPQLGYMVYNQYVQYLLSYHASARRAWQ